MGHLMTVRRVAAACRRLASLGLRMAVLGPVTLAGVATSGQECPVSTIERVSADSSGVPGNAKSEIPVVSANGCVVAFKSFASNLTVGDTNEKVDVFVRDRRADPPLTERIPAPSATHDKQQSKDDSYPPALDWSGELVAFGAFSDNLTPRDFNRSADMFVYRRPERTLETLSLVFEPPPGIDGLFGGGIPNLPPSVSADGRFVVFTSNADEVVPRDNNQTYDVVLFDRNVGRRELISLTTAGSQPGSAGNGPSSGGAVSADGCAVAFYSGASNIVAGDTNQDRDVFVRDRCGGFTERVNQSSGGGQAGRPSDRVLPALELPPAISADGRFVAFVSDQRFLDEFDSAGVSNIFMRDRALGTTTRLSVGLGGEPANEASKSPGMSADGRFVVFESKASNLVPGDTNGRSDVFVADLHSGEMRRVSLSHAGGQADNDSTYPAISADGTLIVFQSDATNLLPGGSGGVSEIFITGNPLSGPPPYGDYCESTCQEGQGCRREIGGEILDGECVPELDCLCVVGGTPTATPTVTPSPTVTETPEEAATPTPTDTTSVPTLTPSVTPTTPVPTVPPSLSPLPTLTPTPGASATSTSTALRTSTPTVTPTATSSGGGGGGGGCGCRIDPETGRVADALPWPALALPLAFWMRRRWVGVHRAYGGAAG